MRAVLRNEPIRQNISRTWEQMTDGRIVTILTVSNATVSDSGYYNCYNIEQNRANYTVYSKQYIFIKGNMQTSNIEDLFIFVLPSGM